MTNNTFSSTNITDIIYSSAEKAAVFDFSSHLLVSAAYQIGLLPMIERAIIGNANNHPIDVLQIAKSGIIPVTAAFGAFAIRATFRDHLDKPYIGGAIAGALKYSGRDYFKGNLDPINLGIKFAVGAANNAAYEINRDHTPEHMKYWSAPIIEGVEGLILGFIGGCRSHPESCLSSGIKHAIFNGLLSAGIGLFLTELGDWYYAQEPEANVQQGMCGLNDPHEYDNQTCIIANSYQEVEL